MTHSHSVGLPLTNDRPVADASTCYNTQHSQETNIHGIRNDNSRKRAATGLRLRSRGHWNRLQSSYNKNTGCTSVTVTLSVSASCPAPVLPLQPRSASSVRSDKRTSTSCVWRLKNSWKGRPRCTGCLLWVSHYKHKRIQCAKCSILNVKSCYT